MSFRSWLGRTIIRVLRIPTDDLWFDIASNREITILQMESRIHKMDVEIMALRGKLSIREELHSRNPALQDAWDQYLTIKNLSK